MNVPRVALISAALLAITTPCIAGSLDAPAPIVFERHGADLGGGSGGPVYTLSIFSDGTVIYDGRYRVRVSGEVKTSVSPAQVQEWLNTLVRSGALNLPDHVPPADGGWYRLSITTQGAANSFRFQGIESKHPVTHTLRGILTTIDAERLWALR